MKFAAAALVATASANTFDFMGEDDLLAQLQVQLVQLALKSRYLLSHFPSIFLFQVLFLSQLLYLNLVRLF